VKSILENGGKGMPIRSCLSADESGPDPDAANVPAVHIEVKWTNAVVAHWIHGFERQFSRHVNDVTGEWWATIFCRGDAAALQHAGGQMKSVGALL
jgi:hypothetical protein